MDFSISLRSRSLAFHETLLGIIPTRTVSDRTCFRRITAWLTAEVEAARLDVEIFQIVLGYAKEARQPGVRNPAAVFVTILKKELKYDPQAMRPTEG